MSDLFRSALGYLSSSSNSSNSTHASQVEPPTVDPYVGQCITLVKNEDSGQKQTNVKISKMIAEGGFSFVFKAIDVSSGEPIALKKIISTDSTSHSVVVQEINLHSQFNHKNIAAFLGTCSRKNNRLTEHFLGIEYCPYKLPKLPIVKIEPLLQIFAQTIEAVNYLHSFGIVHRDLKCENILIGKDFFVKMVDFGSASMEKLQPTPEWSMAQRTRVEEDIARQTTPMYRSPEMLDLWSNHPIDERADLWALGCLLYTLAFGQHPFPDSNKLAIINANYVWPRNSSTLPIVKELVENLLKVDPTTRYSILKIKEILATCREEQLPGLKLLGMIEGIQDMIESDQNEQPGMDSVSANGKLDGIHSAHVAKEAPVIPQNGNTKANVSSVMSSIKGGAFSLIRNIKETSQQYYGSSSSNGRRNSAQSNVQLQHRKNSKEEPFNDSSNPVHNKLPPNQAPAKQPPHRPPPPSPKAQHKPERPLPPESSGVNLLGVEKSQENVISHTQTRISEQQGPKVDLLLDFGSGPNNHAKQKGENLDHTQNDLLNDIFSNAQSVPLSITKPSTNVPNASTGQSSKADLLGDLPDALGSCLTPNMASNAAKKPLDPFDFLLDTSDKNLLHGVNGSDIKTKNQPMNAMGSVTNSQQVTSNFSNLSASSHISGSASYQNLKNVGAMGSAIPGKTLNNLNMNEPLTKKNSSSPNLVQLSDLILEDIVGPGSRASGKAKTMEDTIKPVDNSDSLFMSNPGNFGSRQPASSSAQNSVNNGTKKQNLNDAFGDLLSNNLGFSAVGREDGPRTMNDLRKQELLSSGTLNPVQIKINEWNSGKRKNIRALLSTLHTVTWEGCNWQETNMASMVTPQQVKKAYRKACLAIHPDKQQGSPHEELARMIFVELNEAWAAFEEQNNL